MADTDRRGGDVVADVRALAVRPNVGVVNALYAALYELARRTGQTPRTVLEVCFSEAPSDEEWAASFIPFWREALDEGDAAA